MPKQRLQHAASEERPIPSANTDALISTIVIPVGAAALVAGVGLFFLSGGASAKQDEAPSRRRSSR